ncbi:retrovirus-related pol polyprotein from transposon TNT 1-94 [Tanacetum coccineum]
MGAVRFGNDHFTAITGYGDYVQVNITICHVYYVEGLRQNLFSVGQLCDGDLEVAFRSKTYYVRNLEGDDLLTGAQKLYTISISEMAASFPVCLMSKPLRQSHDHLCYAYERGKSKKSSHPPKMVPSNHSKLELLHMDLCGPMRVASINEKKYILVIVDDYSRCTWVYFLHTKDETPEIIKNFIARNTLRRINFATQQVHNHEDSPSRYSIVVEENKVPPIVNPSEEQTSSISQNNADEFNQEDFAYFDGNTVFVPYDAPNFKEAESSTTALDPSNMHEFHQVQPSTHIWTKAHPLKQVISDPSKHVMTRNKLQTDFELCMYALTVSTFEAKNIKEALSYTPQILYGEGIKTRYCGNSLVVPKSQDEGRIILGAVSTWLLESGRQARVTRQVKAGIVGMDMVVGRGDAENGELKFFLRLQVHQSPRGIFISHSQYVIELLKKHGMDEYVSMSTPMAIERLDADLHGEKLVSLSSKKQDCNAMSTAEAKYFSLSACCAQVIWMRTHLLDYGYKYNKIPMYCDSKSAIAILCNPVQHSRTKPINIQYHFIKEHVEKGTVELYFVRTEYQLADLFTKALPKERFEYLVNRIGMRCMTPTQLESLAKLSS